MSHEIFLQVYKDRECKYKVANLKRDEIGIVEAGFEETETYYLHNDSKYRMFGISIELTNEEFCEVTGVPLELEPNEVKPFKVRWFPPLNIERALEAKLQIKARFIIYAGA